MREFYRLMQRLSAGRGPWKKGRNLALLQLLDEEAGILAAGVQEGLSTRDADLDSTWGAGMLLLGARAFQSEAQHSYTWDVVGQYLRVPTISGCLRPRDYDAMERGARLVWGIPLLRSSTRRARLFRSTMVLHSGGSPKLLMALCACIGSWDAVETWSDAQFETWLTNLKGRLGNLGPLDLRALDSEVGVVAMTERLRGLAAVRAELLESGLVLDSRERTIAAVESEHGSLAAPLGLANPELATAVFDRMFSFEEDSCRTPSRRRFTLLWSLLAEGPGRVVVAVPDKLFPHQLVPLTQRCRLSVLGATPKQASPIYAREGDVFKQVSGPPHLALPEQASFPLSVLAECRTDAGVEELSLGEVPFPRRVITFALDTGEQIKTFPAEGDSVALVAAPGLQLGEAWGRPVRLDSGLDARVGCMPSEAVRIEVIDEQERETFLLAPKVEPLDLRLIGDEVSDAKSGRATVFTTLPLVRVDATSGIHTIELRGPGGVSVRWLQNARVTKPAPLANPPPGKYRLVIQCDDRTCSATFYFAPLLELKLSLVDAVATLSAHLGATALPVHCLARDSHGLGELVLDVDGPESVNLDVHLPIGERTDVVTWRARLLPRIAFLVDSPGGDPTSERQIARLRAGGGVMVFGQPGSTFTISVARRSWTQLIGADGSRFFPLAVIPPEVFEEQKSVKLLVVWTGHCQELGPIEDESGLRPEVAIDRPGDKTLISLKLSRPFAGDVCIEALPAWQPWEPWVRAPASVATRHDGIWYEAALEVPDGPYMVALFAGDQRLSGVRLVDLDRAGSMPPAHLPPLERLLWGPKPPTRAEASAAMAARLGEEDAQHITLGVFRCFARYGPRWFRLVSALTGSLTKWRLLSFLITRVESESEIPNAILRVFDESKVPWCLTRFSDWTEIGQRLAAQPVAEQQLALQEVAELKAGLLVPGFQALMSAGGQPSNFLDVLRPLASIQQHLTPLGSEKVDQLREPGELAPSDLDSDDPRFAALLEARHTEKNLDIMSVPWWDGLTKAWSTSHDEQMENPKMIRAVFVAQIPRLKDIERGVVAFAWKVHRWRRVTQAMVCEGKDEDLDWQELGDLVRLFPRLFDFWLNWFVARNW